MLSTTYQSSIIIIQVLAKLQNQIKLNQQLAFRLSPFRKLDKHRLLHPAKRCNRSKSEQSVGAKKKQRTNNNKYNNQQNLVSNLSSALINSTDEYKGIEYILFALLDKCKQFTFRLSPTDIQ